MTRIPSRNCLPSSSGAYDTIEPTPPLPPLPVPGGSLRMFHVKQQALDFSAPRTKDGEHDSAR